MYLVEYITNLIKSCTFNFQQTKQTSLVYWEANLIYLIPLTVKYCVNSFTTHGYPRKLYQGSVHFKTKNKSTNDLMEVDSFFETLASKGSQVQQVVPVGQGVLQPLLYPLRSKMLLLHELVSHRHDAHQLRLVTANLVLQSLPQTQQLSKSNLRTTPRAKLTGLKANKRVLLIGCQFVKRIEATSDCTTG